MEEQAHVPRCVSVFSGLTFLSSGVHRVLSAVAITAAGAKLLPNQTDKHLPRTDQQCCD